MSFSATQYNQPADSQRSATTNKELVSIILATYNGEAFLETQLESLFAQTYPNIEIIAVDDCSTDRTMIILREYAARHTNMKVFVNERNLGFIKNFEKGCMLSTGDLLAFCDQDDYWDPQKIEKLAAAIGDHPVIYCDSLICDENLTPKGTKISDLVNFKSWNNCLQLAIFCRIYAHTMLFKRTFFLSACPFLDVIPPDWWLPYLSTFSGGMQYFPEALVHYRQHAGNVTGVIGGKGKKESGMSDAGRKKLAVEKIRKRIRAFYDSCPAGFIKEKEVLHEVMKSYQDFSVKNNINRCVLFLQHRDTFLSVKKHSALHRFLFCFKMLFKIK